MGKDFTVATYVNLMIILCCFVLYQIRLESEKDMLTHELLSMREMSSKVIEDRLHLENERKIIESKLVEKTRQTNLLELKLKR